jgi:hypothetical protein
VLDRLEIPDERRDLRSGSFLDFGRRLVRLRYLSVPVAPDWHFSLTMSSNNPTPIDNVSYFIKWEYAPVRFGDPGQIGRSSLQGFGKSPIAMPLDPVTGHAGNLIFDNSKMGIFGSGCHAERELEHQGKAKYCVNSPTGSWESSIPFHEGLSMNCIRRIDQ